MFCNWQLFKRPVGYATTNRNSPIESYNNTIKSQFTHRLKYHMIPIPAGSIQ